MNKSGNIRADGAGGDEERRPPRPGPSRRRYHRDALAAVLAMLGTISPEAPALFAAIVAIRGDRLGPDERVLDRAELMTVLKLEKDDALDRYVVEVGDRIDEVTGLKCLDTKCRAALLAHAHNVDETERRPTPLDLIIAKPASGAAGHKPASVPVLLGWAFAELLDDPHPPASKSALVPRLDRAGQADIAMVEAIMAAGIGGHLAVRRTSQAPRETRDLAAILGSEDREVLAYDGPDSLCFAAILRAELHAGERPVLMIVDRDLLIADAPPHEDSWDEPAAREREEPAVSSFARDLPPRVAGARGLYLWSISEGRSMPCASLPWIGACIGPVRFDPAWARGIVAGHLGIAGDGARSQGIAALARRFQDPRDAGAMATMARAITAGSNDDLDQACTRVAASFAEAASDALPTPSTWRWPRAVSPGWTARERSSSKALRPA